MKKNYSRIMIFGRPGSGKSTFAHKLHKLTELPLYHLDKYFFTANWVKRDYQEFLQKQQGLVDKNLWIIDGTQIKSLEMRYARAELCIFLNLPRWICYIRIFKRLFGFKNSQIQDRAKGCKETINKSFLSLLKYMWKFDARVAKSIADLRKKYPHVEFIEIKNDKELEQLKRNWHNETV